MTIRSAFVRSACLVALSCLFMETAGAQQIERGKYLVSVGSCHDCHTAGTLLGKPDFTRALGGSDVGFALPNGIFYGPNLTPDRETGLGEWTDDQIVTAITTGVRPDGRELAPIMPWRNLSALNKDDAYAIAAYLKTLPPVKHQVPGPLGPSEKPATFVMTLVPPSK